VTVCPAGSRRPRDRRKADRPGHHRVAVLGPEQCQHPAILRAELRRLFRWLKDKGLTAVITAELSTVLVSGTAGTGKTSLAAHFADAACRRGERVLYFLFEESPHQLIRTCAPGFFTSLTPGKNESEETEAGISSLMDTWIVMTFDEVNKQRRRAIRILKSRGMAHSNDIREYALTDRGLRISDSGG
jgi:hypothetical protein